METDACREGCPRAALWGGFGTFRRGFDGVAVDFPTNNPFRPHIERPFFMLFRSFMVKEREDRQGRLHALVPGGTHRPVWRTAQVRLTVRTRKRPEESYHEEHEERAEAPEPVQAIGAPLSRPGAGP